MRCFLPCFSASKRKNHFSSEPCHPIQQNPVLEESIQWISSESKTKENNEEQECSDSLFSVSIGKPVSPQENVGEIEVNSTPMKQVSEKEQDRRVNQSVLEYRYDDDSHNEKTEEGSSESSLFSLSTDFSNRKRISFSSTEKVDNEVTSKMVALQEENDNDDEVFSVLNPIENVIQEKVKVVNPIKKDKENMNWIEEKTSLKVSSSSKEKEEIRVDISLSDWLVESENNDNRPILRALRVEEIRPILRALTVEEIRKCSSVSKTCLESNKYVKDGKQDWNSTTIKTRLEPASVEN